MSFGNFCMKFLQKNSKYFEKVVILQLFSYFFLKKKSWILQKQVIWSFSAKIITGRFQIPQKNLPWSFK